MLYSLLITALLMGLGGIPHCGAMCAAPCAAGLPAGVPWPALAGRTVGYALLGAVAAGATSLLSAWSRWVGVLQPLWVMLLAAAVLLGAWMALKGEMPARLQAQGMRWYRQVQGAMDGPVLGTRPWLRTLVPMMLGLAWAALPCGLLYGAVMVAALAPSAAEGALVMAAFSLPGALALWWLPRRLRIWHAAPAGAAVPGAVVPVLWLGRVTGQEPPRASPAPALPGGLPARWAWLADPRWALRVSGALLSAAAAWALAHRLLEQWQAWCA